MAECKACGHRDTQHAKFGCNQGFCKCELSNQDVIDFEKLAALREAGEKMAERLRDNRSASAMANSTIQKILLFSQKDSDALAEWEAANK